MYFCIATFVVMLLGFGSVKIEGVQHPEYSESSEDELQMSSAMRDYLICSDSCINFTEWKVEPIFNRNFSQIHLNFSWTLASQDTSENIQIDIHNIGTGEAEEPNCLDHTRYSLEKSHLIMPRLDMLLEKTEINPGCVYVFEAWTKDKTCCRNFTYKVPECVGPKCDCRLYKPELKILDVRYDSNIENLTLHWVPTDLKAGNRTQNITKFFISRVTSNNQKNIFRSDEWETDLNKRRLWSSVQKLTEGENYTLYAEVDNNFICSAEITYEFFLPKKIHSNNNYLILLIVSLVFLLVLIVKWKLIVKFREKIFSLLPGRFQINRPQVTPNHFNVRMQDNLCYTPIEFEEDQLDIYQFPRNKLEFKELIGQGAFGQVFSAKAFGIEGIGKSKIFKMVAVKTLGENVTSEALDDFKTEIEIFKKIEDHPNIVKLLGYCTLETPLLVIMEFVPCGDLKNYLLDLRKQWLKKKSCQNQIFFPDNSDGAYIQPETHSGPLSITTGRLPSITETWSTQSEEPITPPSTPLTPLTPLISSYTLEKVLDHTELQNFAFQIARGMAHLEKIPITHRDLAARNILINEYKELKISDFGMSRSGPYINHKTKKFPLRWMALEAIIEQKYDSRTDVWSFGVVLWEIATLGAFPYENVPDNFILQFLQMDNRLQRPEICTDVLYDVMLRCWEASAERRPTFKDLEEALDVKKSHVYVDFSQLNPTYVFPPAEVKNDVTIACAQLND